MEGRGGPEPGAKRQDPYATALRLLAARDLSSFELAARLRRRGHADEQIDQVLKRCRELGYLDDRRYAEQRARSLQSSGRAVGRRLVAELKNRGLSDAEAQRAQQAAGEEFAEAQVLRELFERRYPRFSYHQADERERRRVVNYFLRRGFPLALVLSTLQDQDER
ncbi:hypothetical protein DESUT3_32380 [Desulfuromonas versatilis]|uniref:Regulatory protein RecX n=1 Tax=Desulfuromonas versatilis TaxID=2802975 RepID=A0ABM7NGG3_9BACT|nr:regulatory protein RecX [Desulfuromonas versatilis]BCR06169.1 hypothetical protein DESUT3_32380 [Desulfuromonas versatilis]